MRKLSNVALAYIAGLIDAKGYILYRFGYLAKAHPHEGAETYISVSTTYKPILVYLQSTRGGAIHANPPKNPKHKMRWIWRLSSRPTFTLLGRMAPYLQIKREQANLLLKNEALITKTGPRTDSEKKRLRGLTKKMRALTKRGLM